MRLSELGIIILILKLQIISLGIRAVGHFGKLELSNCCTFIEIYIVEFWYSKRSITESMSQNYVFCTLMNRLLIKLIYLSIYLFMVISRDRNFENILLRYIWMLWWRFFNVWIVCFPTRLVQSDTPFKSEIFIVKELYVAAAAATAMPKNNIYVSYCRIINLYFTRNY